MLFLLTLGHFWCSVVTSVTLSSNLSNFEKNPKKIQKIQNSIKISKSVIKSKKIKNQKINLKKTPTNHLENKKNGKCKNKVKNL